MKTALVLVLVAVGSVVFHLLSPWWWTPIASNWHYIDGTIEITFWITGVVFTAIVLFTAYCVWRFRHREGNVADYKPENKRLESWLTVATGVGRGGDAGAGAGGLGPVRRGAGRCDRGRGGGPAMAMDLPAARQGRQARHRLDTRRSRRRTRSASMPTTRPARTTC